ncbi:MAG: DNA polymerase III subunit delta' [Rhizobiaceae bacterium]|nr:DNA polymerase III subunit delta' [Rhizobiaceae bacterium]
MSEDLLVADALDGIPHPCETQRIIGHSTAIAAFLDQYASGRLHHAHLVTGPKGIGKATLCLRLAAHLLKNPQATTAAKALEDAAPANPVDAQIAARSHPNVLHMTKPWDEKAKKFKTQLTVDEVRKTITFFGTSRGEAGWRVAIVDAADDMNQNAANALLKVLEEPPKDTVFFVLSHAPAKVLPTIRSRCQHMPLKALSDPELQEVLSQLGVTSGLADEEKTLVSGLAQGSVRDAILLVQEDGLELYQSFISLCEGLPATDWGAVHALADRVIGKGKEERYQLLMSFAEKFMEDKAKATNNGQTSISVLARWAQVWEKTRNSIRTSDAYNLDRKQVIINLFQDLGQASQG